MADDDFLVGIAVKVPWLCPVLEERRYAVVDTGLFPDGVRVNVNRYICGIGDNNEGGPEVEARTVGVAFSAWARCKECGLKHFSCERYK